MYECGTVGALVFEAGDVGGPCPGFVIRRLHTYLELVFLVIQGGWRKPDCIERVELLRDARECGPELVVALQFEVAAAGRFGELPQAAIRIRHLSAHLRREADRI